MKFKTLKMKNFMRYKGVNEIEFSCDSEKNVTVILGDNTVGKTTLAQAFRWCLYGAILKERDKKESDYQLLNNDVLSGLDANKNATVFVEITAMDSESLYTIHREVQYMRVYPKLLAKESYKVLKAFVADINSPDIRREIEPGPKYALTNEFINELFPKNLSNYFLFDGERWSDFAINGVKEDIKESVHILTGLSAYRLAMMHLKDSGDTSVIKKFRKNIQGKGNIYDDYGRELTRLEREIEQCKHNLESLDATISHFSKKSREVELYLEANKDTEELQKAYKQYQSILRAQNEGYIANFKNFVTEYDQTAYREFARPLIEASLKMVKSVAGERRDIPHMKQASIDFIIKSGRCICGTPITKGSHELECLLEQRNYLPPADMGSLLGEFERTAGRWNRAENELTEDAKQVDDCARNYEDTLIQLHKIEQKIDENINFAEKRSELRRYQDEADRAARKKGEIRALIESKQSRIHSIELQMHSQELKNAENEKWRRRVELAEAVYNRISADFSKEEKKIFNELNEEIQANFQKMFNAKDKKIQLTENYEIQMCYNTGVGYREERNLSEGEKVARNFAFIVTIMDYSRRKKLERNAGKHEENRLNDDDTLPIVLDGPFSKLGDENISLVAGVLPKVSEQVIVFMLRKDWVHTGLDRYVGAEYLIDKKPEEAYASIRKVERA